MDEQVYLLENPDEATRDPEESPQSGPPRDEAVKGVLAVSRPEPPTVQVHAPGEAMSCAPVPASIGLVTWRCSARAPFWGAPTALSSQRMLSLPFRHLLMMIPGKLPAKRRLRIRPCPG